MNGGHSSFVFFIFEKNDPYFLIHKSNVMNPLLRNILVLIGGVFVGGLVNMGLIMLGPLIIPPPEGFDVTTTEGLKEGMLHMKPKNFIFPFLAHALGTLTGAYFVAKLAVSHHMRLGMVVGFVFLLGGMMMVMSLPSPMWFNILDLVGAYIPMAWLGGKLAGRGFSQGPKEL